MFKILMCQLIGLFQSLKVLKNADFMPYIIFLAAPSAEALMVMYEEGRRKGKFRGKSGPGTVDVRTVSNVYSSIGVELNITDKQNISA